MTNINARQQIYDIVLQKNKLEDDKENKAREGEKHNELITHNNGNDASKINIDDDNNIKSTAMDLTMKKSKYAKDIYYFSILQNNIDLLQKKNTNVDDIHNKTDNDDDTKKQKNEEDFPSTKNNEERNWIFTMTSLLVVVSVCTGIIFIFKTTSARRRR